MISHWTKCLFAAFLLCSVAAAPSVFAQETGMATAVVTAVTKSQENIGTVPRDSITLLVNRKDQGISRWTPLPGSSGGLQLVIFIDDSARSSLALQLNDIRDFINALPPGTEVAVAYMRNGTAYMAQPFTRDHTAAVHALRIPLSSGPGSNGSPYFGLQDLLKRWPESGALRREVIMVTDGIDRYDGRRFDAEDPYVQSAIKDAQKAGVIVYSIYFRDTGRLDRSNFAINGGQNYLTQLSHDTGGEVYYIGFGNPVSFAPFLDDIQRKIQNQYELSFTAAPRKDLVPIRVKTAEPNTKLQAPAQVPVRVSSMQ